METSDYREPVRPEYAEQRASPLPEYRPRRRRRIFSTLLKLVAVISVLTLGLLSYEVISSGTSPQEVIAQLARLISSGDRPLNGEADGRINILLLGIGGSGHEGPLLTDSMLLASIRPSTQQVALISIPRDLQVDIPGIGFRRINNAYALPELKQRGSGGAVASATVSATFGVPVHYYLLLDFNGFAQLVDTLG
ncbi:MAG: LCP family protein, partial [Patescibacteria group bacterium]|nr:LCP family protein [Patescibacteria group bacterium]